MQGLHGFPFIKTGPSITVLTKAKNVRAEAKDFEKTPCVINQSHSFTILDAFGLPQKVMVVVYFPVSQSDSTVK